MKYLLLYSLLTFFLFAEVNVGDKAPNFTLKTLDGKQIHTMQEFKGKVVLLNLWASWCKGCKKEMPEFITLQKQNTKDFKLVAVSLDDSKDKASHFLSTLKQKIPFTVLHDSKKHLAKAYSCSAMPSSYLIDKNGVIQQILIGSLNHNDIKVLQEKINALKKKEKR